MRRAVEDGKLKESPDHELAAGERHSLAGAGVVAELRVEHIDLAMYDDDAVESSACQSQPRKSLSVIKPLSAAGSTPISAAAAVHRLASLELDQEGTMSSSKPLFEPEVRLPRSHLSRP